MNTTEVFKSFVDDLQAAFSDSISPVEFDTDKTVAHLESNYYQHILKIFQKDDTFFDEDRNLFDVNLSILWKQESTTPEIKETIWKHLHTTMIASFLHGDLKDKVGTVLSTLKGLWSGKDDEVSKVLNDEKSEGHFKALFDYLMETKIAKLFLEMMEELDFSSIDLNVSNPTEILEIIKNPEHPIVKNIIQKIQGLLKKKAASGAFTPTELQGEIEGIKARFTGLFGNVFNDMIGGNKSELPSNVLMGSSPEARRQRMIARLQKKQRDKNL